MNKIMLITEITLLTIAIYFGFAQQPDSGILVAIIALWTRMIHQEEFL